MKSSKRNNIPKVVAAFIATTVIVVAGVLSLVYHQEILDTFEGLTYTPSESVIDIENKIAITPAGMRIFHATAPSVISAEAFNVACPRQEVTSPIIGCYTPQDAIYIYDVRNQSLGGMRDVTAAHELLHAVWKRMSPAEQRHIGGLLQEEYSKVAEDDSLEERMAYYGRTQSGQERNELHSIIGTEFQSLGSELEAHYSKYFDRAAVVNLYEGYHRHYESLSKSVATLQDQLESLSVSITEQNGTYSTDAAQLESDIRSFNNKAQSGLFTTQSQFIVERRNLESRVDTLNGRRDAINNLIREYNDLYRQYREAGEEIQTLNNSIDSFKALDESSSLENL